jgi:hypothetical protein
MSDLRYPIGNFSMPTSITDAMRMQYIETIAETPAALRDAVSGLTDAQLDTPYRPEGWTVRQSVHHVVDSHINAYVRFKLALTEDAPMIRTYNEKRWAELEEARTAPLSLSLPLLEALHIRWVAMLITLTPSDYARPFVHPDRGQRNVDFNLAMYAWHGPHHVAHITSLREREGW